MRLLLASNVLLTYGWRDYCCWQRGLLSLLLTTGVIARVKWGLLLMSTIVSGNRELLLTMVIACNKNNAGNGSYILLTLVVIVNVKYCYCWYRHLWLTSGVIAGNGLLLTTKVYCSHRIYCWVEGALLTQSMLCKEIPVGPVL